MEKRTACRAAALAIALLAVHAPSALAQAASYVAASPDGSHVLFATNERLTSDDTDTASDLYDRTATGLKRISTGPAGGNGNFPVGVAQFRHISTDGSRVTFISSESLTDDDVDNQPDVYQRVGDTTTRLSQGPIGGNSPTGTVASTIESADGTTVAFMTNEALVSGDVSGNDVYVWRGNETFLATPAAGQHLVAGISSDGTRVFVQSNGVLAAGDGDGAADVYEWTQAGLTRLSGGSANIAAPFVGASRDGTRVFFASIEQLASDGDGSVDVYEASGGTISKVSTGSVGGEGAFDAFFVGASADGTRVFFRSKEALEPGENDSAEDIFERRNGTATFRVTPGMFTVDATFERASEDGSKVFFKTLEALEGGGAPDGLPDIFVTDSSGTRVVSTGPAGGNGAFEPTFVGISADGSRAFFSTEEKLTADDTDAEFDIYERAGDVTTRISTGPGGGNGAFDAVTGFSGVSRDGSRVFFFTAEALTPNDGDALTDVYERSNGVTRLLSGEGIPPVTSITGGPAAGGTVADKTPEFAFSADEESTFACGVDDGATAPCTSPHTTADLGDGEHTFRVVATDRFGNVGPPIERTFTVDTTPPDTSITSGPSGATNQTAVQFGFEATEAGAKFQCRLDGAAFADCTAPFTAVALSEGAHAFEVRAADAVGNVDESPASRSITVDSQAPDTRITGGPAGGATISDRTPTFTFVANEPAAFECNIDGTAFVACSSPHVTVALSNGTHTLQVRARDAAGNVEDSPALRSFTVQASGPAATHRLDITSRSLRLDRKRRIAVALRCFGPASGSCRGTVRIRTRGRVRTSRGRRVVTLAAIRFTVRGDSRKIVKLTPSRANRTLIQRLRRVSVTVSATVTDGRAVSRKMTLRGR